MLLGAHRFAVEAVFKRGHEVSFLGAGAVLMRNVGVRDAVGVDLGAADVGFDCDAHFGGRQRLDNWKDDVILVMVEETDGLMVCSIEE